MVAIAGLMESIAADAAIDRAYEWLCDSRDHHWHNSDVWDLRWQWSHIKPRIQQQLQAGTYRFSAVRRFRSGNDIIEYWSAQDALVLKAVALVLTDRLEMHLSDRCHHVRGHGGAKAAVRRVADQAPQHRFVFRTDVKRFYASIDHDILMAQLERHITDRRVLDLLWRYMKRTIYDDGLWRDSKRGISLGCPLSPLMGALYLKPLDDAMADSGLFYARFMDDWVVLAPTRWKLRKAVALVNQTLNQLNVWRHPDKTFIGRRKGLIS